MTSSIAWAATELRAYRPEVIKTVLPTDISGSRPPSRSAPSVVADGAARHAGQHTGQHARRPHRPSPAARRPTARRRPRRIPRPDSVAEERGGPTAWPTPWPDSVANIVRPDSVANIRGPTAWLMCDLFRQRLSVSTTSRITRPDSVAVHGERRPDSVANFKARELRGRLRGPRVAWPTSRPASCVADVQPAQAEAERKHERKGAGAEVEEVQAGRALSTPTTQHLRRCSQTGNTQRASRQERRVRIIVSNFSFKMMPLAA